MRSIACKGTNVMMEAPNHTYLARMFDLTDKVALVTGSSGGIGLALAGALAAAGARVILNGRDPERLKAAADTLVAQGSSPQTAVFDVTRSDQIDETLTTCIAENGRIDILINNAGIQHRAPLHEFPEDAFRRVIDTNLTSAFLVGQRVAKSMIEQGSGSIINICSVQSELARPGIAPYSASKGGLKMLTKGMALDWGRFGIRVNGLAPGYFKTELNKALVEDKTFSGWLEQRTPLGRWGDTEELIGAAIFLASGASSFVTGHVLYVDGGITGCL